MIFDDDHDFDEYQSEATPWSTAEGKVIKAGQLYENGQMEQALGQLNEAITINPSNYTWHFNKALTLDALGRFDEAIEEYELALESSDNDVEILNCMAINYTRSCQYDLAISTFENIQQIDPSFEPCYCYRIITYTEMGKHDCAEEMFYLVQQIKQDCPMCYYNIGNSFFVRADYKRAIWCWEKTASLEPDHPQINYRIAQGHWADGQMEKARIHFLAELKQNPGDLDAVFDFGIFLLHLNQLDSASEKFNRILEIDENFAPAIHYLGEISLSRGEIAKAEKLFEKALIRDDQITGPRYRLGQLFLERQKADKAFDFLLGELELGFSDTEVLLSIGTMMAEMGRLDYAVHCFLRVADLDSANAVNYLNLGIVLAQRGDYNDALQFLLHSLDLEPKNIKTLTNTSLVLMHMGRFAEAMEKIKIARSLSGRDWHIIRLQFTIGSKLLKQKIKSRLKKLMISD